MLSLKISILLLHTGPFPGKHCDQKDITCLCPVNIYYNKGLPCSSNSNKSACDAGDQGLIPRSGRSSEEENGNPLQYSCLENIMDREVCQGVSKSWTQLSD